ncbi:MAG: hypothetical protein IJS09_11120 [Treponema sp.]|nr:hypothetical protein [Treponema sp.]
MKKTRKNIVIAGATIALLVIFGTFCAIKVFRKPLVAFYRIPETNVPAIKELLKNEASFIQYDNSVSLYYQLRNGRKPDIVLTTSGQPLKTAETLAPNTVSLPPEFFANITSSIREATTKASGETFKSLPFLSSHTEIDIEVRKMRKTSVKNINTWNDIARFIKESKKIFDDYGMIFAGRDGQLMLDMLSAYTEALNGKTAYDTAISLIQEYIEECNKKGKRLNMDEIAERLAGTPDAPLYQAVQFLRKWLKEGLISPESFNMDKKAVAAFMKNNLASVVIMSLDDHRSIEHDTIEPFTSIFFPSELTADRRHFVAPIFYAVPFTKNKKNTVLIEKLISTESQETLSRTTGLAPVLARCRTPDKQADDARYWVAATNAPLPSLSRETTLSDEQLNSLGFALGVLIRK